MTDPSSPYNRFTSNSNSQQQQQLNNANGSSSNRNTNTPFTQFGMAPASNTPAVNIFNSDLYNIILINKSY
jgi:hypothetical protein